jgi:hypothetical protein
MGGTAVWGRRGFAGDLKRMGIRSSLRSAVLLTAEARRLRNAKEKPASERLGSKIIDASLSAASDEVHD